MKETIKYLTTTTLDKFIFVISCIVVSLNLLNFAFTIFDIWFVSIIVSSLFKINFMLLFYLPIYWFYKIQSNKERNVYIIIYGAFVGVLSLFFIFWSLTIIHDIKTDNGWENIDEYQLDNGEYLIVYESPDEGATGGNYILPAIVTKLCFGLEKRKFLNDRKLSIDSQYIHYKNQVFKIISQQKPHDRNWINYYAN